MSSTRYDEDGRPGHRDRYASDPAHRGSLNAKQVAKRCALLRHDPQLAELLWMIQEASLHDSFEVGGRVGSVESIARQLIDVAGYEPEREITVCCIGCADVSEYQHTRTPQELEEDRQRTAARVADGLRQIASNPDLPTAYQLEVIGPDWRQALIAQRTRLKEAAKERLAPTSVAKRVAAALRFTRDCRKPSLVIGNPRLGKSATAKAFCAGSAGLVRYVLTPEDTNTGSLYRSVAKALGLADATSRADTHVRNDVEATLAGARLMLVFDEAHNLFPGSMRPQRVPQRAMWVRRLIDMGVPVAFVAVPEFYTRVRRHAEQLDWDATQITELIAHEVALPEELSPADFGILVERLAPGLTRAAKAQIAAAAKGQRGAQFVVDVLEVARYAAREAGREDVTDADVASALGLRPTLTKRLVTDKPRGRSKKAARSTPAPAQAPVVAAPAHGPRRADPAPMVPPSRTRNAAVPAAF